ncbi:MAG: sensor histidine kinase [Anaerolineales bacterium]|nr:sensor histidine kinase [Anaerolineales bacterium]MCX7607719.1 sensor histidine kinase [Anaerolineales bacterium]
MSVLQNELAEVERSLKEVSLLLEQSRVEVGKLTQRNAAVTAHLQQINHQIGSVPPEDVKRAYDSALDAQQRLFVMRSQLEKLQNDQLHFERQKKLIEQLKAMLEQGDLNKPSKGGRSALESLEMLINAQEAERQRLARQMHDGPAQALSNFILQTEIALKLLDIEPEKARAELNSLKISAFNTFQKVRNFISELRPMMLDDLGVVPTIRRYVEMYKEQTGADINMTFSGQERRLESYIEVMIFRALQELLAVAVHQNQASSIKIQLDFGDSWVKLSVDDNGKGFDTDGLETDKNLGLKLIKERVQMVGGTFAMDSAPGMGSRISLNIPISA